MQCASKAIVMSAAPKNITGLSVNGGVPRVKQSRPSELAAKLRLPVPRGALGSATAIKSTMLCERSPSVDGRPFILMERVDGVRIEETAQREEARDIAASAVNVLKRMQALQIEQTGIGDEEPVGLRQEMMRWAMLMQRAPEELTVRAAELGGLLAVQVPVERTPTLKEMATTGHPLLVPNTSSYSGWLKIPEMEWLRSYISFPLIINGKVKGFLNLSSVTADFFTAQKQCVGPKYMQCWSEYWAWTKSAEFKSAMTDMVRKPDFLDRIEAWDGCPIRQEDEQVGLSDRLAGPMGGIIVDQVND